MKYLSFIIFSIILFSNSLFARDNATVDSLRATISNQTGETYVNSLNEISTVLFQKKKLEDANTFATEAMSKAKEMKYLNGIAEANDRLGLVCQAKYDYTNAMKYFVEALKIRNSLDDKKGIATSKNLIGVVFFQQEDPESGE